ncbi:MAG: GNAT family N-acetyltransferase [Fibromonadales bacterium]|nr:GNAT family N-acetyltransferase [Fibromonadales bacterium]
MNYTESLNNLNACVIRLNNDTEIKSFESGDEDLNNFLLNDAKDYLASLLSVTYVIKTDTDTVAYYCLSNDRLSQRAEEKSIWNKINRLVSNKKRRKSYPAVKIGRLAVSTKFAKMGIGSMIIDIITTLYKNSSSQHAGCRFIIVDAYKNALPFYEKNGFRYLTENDEKDSTRIMYLDLKAVE